MHKLISIDQAARDRFIELENEETGTIDECFDDSASISDDHNFNFMQIGKLYNCKIALFGAFTDIEDSDSVEVKADAPEVVIGKSIFLEVWKDDDIYYISKGDLIGVDLAREPYFSYSRKDLTQVNDVIHAECFWDF